MAVHYPQSLVSTGWFGYCPGLFVKADMLNQPLFSTTFFSAEEKHGRNI
jgi:hypothetical protein